MSYPGNKEFGTHWCARCDSEIKDGEPSINAAGSSMVIVAELDASCERLTALEQLAAEVLRLEDEAGGEASADFWMASNHWIRLVKLAQKARQG